MGVPTTVEGLAEYLDTIPKSELRGVLSEVMNELPQTGDSLIQAAWDQVSTEQLVGDTYQRLSQWLDELTVAALGAMQAISFLNVLAKANLDGRRELHAELVDKLTNMQRQVLDAIGEAHNVFTEATGAIEADKRKRVS
jgi:hypothetical protein